MCVYVCICVCMCVCVCVYVCVCMYVCVCVSDHLCSVRRKDVVVGAVPPVSVRVGELHWHQRGAAVALLGAVGPPVVDAEQPRVRRAPGHLIATTEE